MLSTQTYINTHIHAHTLTYISHIPEQWQPFSIGKQFWQENSVATEVQVSHLLCILPYIYLPHFSIAKYRFMYVFAFFNHFEIYFHLITWETSWSQIFLCNSVEKMRANTYIQYMYVCIFYKYWSFSQIHTLSIFVT